MPSIVAIVDYRKSKKKNFFNHLVAIVELPMQTILNTIQITVVDCSHRYYK